MARNYVQGIYVPQNSDRYVGQKNPIYRSSWEMNFCLFLDTHPSVLSWGSECVKIPYINPLTGKSTIYIPDFLMVYQHKSGAKIADLVEIKPMAQAQMREGKMQPHEQATVLKNHAKWKSAMKWCKNFGLNFRVLTELDLMHLGGQRRR